MGYNINGKDTGVPLDMVQAIISGFNVPYFVETGTASGFSISKASMLFTKCHTIEVVEGRTPKQIEMTLVDEEDPTIVTYPKLDIAYNPNIRFHIGDSSQILPEIVTEIGDNYCVYWLDAHYSDTETPPEDLVECPILEEIKAIRKNRKAIIIIDDARFFIGTPPPPATPHKWATLQEIFNLFLLFFPLHYFTVIDDYIICIPQVMRNNLNTYWSETFNKRYP